MKYLENDLFDALNCALSSIETPDEKIVGRIEAYSCKDTGNDKQLRRQLEAKLQEEMDEAEQLILSLPNSYGASLGANGNPSFTSPGNGMSMGNPSFTSPGGFGSSAYSFSRSLVSPFGPLTETTSRRTFFYLIATLNAVYPDYDFSGMRYEVFSKLPSLSIVQNTVQNTLFKIATPPAVGSLLGTSPSSTNYHYTLQQQLWAAIDESICLADCDCYSFNPDWNCDPCSDEPTLWAYHFFFVNKKLKRIVFFSYRSVSQIANKDDDSYDDEFYMEDVDNGQDSNDLHYDSYQQAMYV